MNILFYLDHSVSSGFGGIEHATEQVANAISLKGCRCYYIYRVLNSRDLDISRESPFIDYAYVPDLQQDKQFVLNKIKEWNIDSVIVQSVFDDSVLVWRSIIDNLGRSCKLVFAYHYNPGSEFDYLRDWNFSLKSFLARIRWRRYVKRTYHLIWETVDTVVVLSKSHVKPWMTLSSADSPDKFKVIPNMNSFTDSLPVEELYKKEKIVLIVSRLSEHEKKISRLLELWRKIEQDSAYQDWKLLIVGEGPDGKTYEQYAKDNLKNYEFVGKQPSQEYYRKASLFVMASAQEGWGLVITEAQQMGCVPIVLNTFSSASEMIENDRNGYLVSSMASFSCILKSLMRDSTKRQSMAKQAIEDSVRFSQSAVGEIWVNLLNM